MLKRGGTFKGAWGEWHISTAVDTDWDNPVKNCSHRTHWQGKVSQSAITFSGAHGYFPGSNQLPNRMTDRTVHYYHFTPPTHMVISSSQIHKAIMESMWNGLPLPNLYTWSLPGLCLDLRNANFEICMPAWDILEHAWSVQGKFYFNKIPDIYCLELAWSMPGTYLGRNIFATYNSFL